MLRNSLAARTRSLLPSQFYLDHSHCAVLAPATLAALPSTRAIPDRDVFYVAHPTRLHSPAKEIGADLNSWHLLNRARQIPTSTPLI
jgi:hypothetical protein